MIHELASINWSDFKWFLDWLSISSCHENFDQMLRSPTGDSNSFSECLHIMRAIVGDINDHKLQNAFSSSLSCSISKWIATSWPVLESIRDHNKHMIY